MGLQPLLGGFAHVRAQRLTRVLSDFSPTFPGFYLYDPSRRQQAPKMSAFVDYVLKHGKGHPRLTERCGAAV